MSDDLVKRLQYLGRCAKDYDREHMTSADYEMIPIVTGEAADRIEELEAKLKQEIKETERVDRVWSDNYEELEAKLDTLRGYTAHDFDCSINTYPAKACSCGLSEVLAELKGQDDE